jgi:hypothetical protein
MEFEEFRDTVEQSSEAAYALGCRILAGPWEDRHHAEQAFELAAGAGPEMWWRIADAYVLAFDGRADSWHRRAVASASTPGGIEVDPDTLHIVSTDGYLAGQYWVIRVRADDPNRVTAALKAVVPRLMATDENGREYAGDDEFPDDVYTPNYAAVDADAPVVWIDCKDQIMPLMSRAMVRIVIEELRAAGVARALIHSLER